MTASLFFLFFQDSFEKGQQYESEAQYRSTFESEAEQSSLEPEDLHTPNHRLAAVPSLSEKSCMVPPQSSFQIVNRRPSAPEELAHSSGELELPNTSFLDFQHQELDFPLNVPDHSTAVPYQVVAGNTNTDEIKQILLTLVKKVDGNKR